MTPHRTDLGSLFFGLTFVGIAAWWTFASRANWENSGGWLAIGLLAIIGTVGLFGALRPRPKAAPDGLDPAPRTVGD